MERILVIEDSAVVQAQLADLLAEQYAVTFEETGAKGLALAFADPPGLVLLDINLPGIDGYEVCRRLKAAASTRGVPVIFITSMDSAAEKVAGFAAGGEDYVVKPFHATELLARIKSHLDLRRMREQAVELERLTLFREMAVALSHEINNPLTAVYGYLHFIENDQALSESSRVRLADLRAEIGRIKRIVGRLADASIAATTEYVSGVSMINLHDKES